MRTDFTGPVNGENNSVTYGLKSRLLQFVHFEHVLRTVLRFIDNMVVLLVFLRG